MRELKIYKHEGKGHWIGSCVILLAPSRQEADATIRKKLDSEGLSKEPLDIEEIDPKIPRFVYVNNGEY